MILLNGLIHGLVGNNFMLNNTHCPECGGNCEHKTITHDVRFRDTLYSFQGVPARVCNACGAVYLDAATLKQIESVFKKHTQPEKYQKVPLFSFGQLAAV